MKVTKIFRRYWHDLYYKNNSPRRMSFAMHCQAVTESYDLRQQPETLSERLRLQVHLSLCQACKNYVLISQALGNAVRSSSIQRDDKPTLDKLNKALLLRHGKPEQPKKS